MPQVAMVQVDIARLDFLIDQVEPRANALLDKAAFDIERTAKPMTAFRTGAMRTSGYVSGVASGSTYNIGAAQASTLRPGVNILEEVTPDGPFERVIGFSVEYAFWQELVRPFLVPATEQVRPQFLEAWNELLQ